MKELLRITLDDSAEAAGSPDRFGLELPDSLDGMKELTVAMVNLSMDRQELLSVIMNTAASLVSNSDDPMGKLEHFGSVVRDNVKIIQARQESHKMNS